MKPYLALIAVAMQFTWGANCRAQTVVSANETKSKKVIESQSDRAPTQHERVVVGYLTKIDRVVREREQSDIEKYKSQQREYVGRDAEISRSEAKILKDIRTTVEGTHKGKLSFENGSTERTLLIPNSDSGARIILSLYKEGFVDPSSLTPVVSLAENLSNDWIALFQLIESDSTAHSPQWNISVKALYKAGIERQKHREDLVLLARNGGADALSLLFFETDRSSGQLAPVISASNIRLLDDFSDEKSSGIAKLYAVHLVCCGYALAQRDYPVCLKLCNDLLNLPYEGFGKDEDVTNMNDYRVYDAKRRALHFLFFHMADRPAFELVYARSRIVETQVREHDSTLANGIRDLVKPQVKWLQYDSYALARLEIRDAQSLVTMAEMWEAENEKN